MWRAGAVICLLGGCDGAPETADLSAVADLSEPSLDLAWSSCAGTALAGTCVARFFDSFAACFRPAGHCAPYYGISGGACWENGARYTDDPFENFAEFFQIGSQQCLGRTDYRSQPGGALVFEQYCVPGDANCGDAQTDGGVVPVGGGVYDHETGVFTCPDGTQVDVGPALGGCAVLNELLDPFCDGEINSGQCPLP